MTFTPQINCDDCGACCRHIGYPPFLDFEIIELPIELKDQLFRHKSKLVKPYITNTPCIWYSDKRCLHYSHRPLICRDFVVGSEECMEARKFYQISTHQ